MSGSGAALFLLLGVGGGGDFTPSDLPNLALWFDASRAGSVLTGGASQFVAASSQYLSGADNASLSTGHIDYWWSVWFYADSAPTYGMIVAKAAEYEIRRSTTTNNLEFVVGANGGTPLVTTGLPYTLGAWHHAFAYLDSVASISYLSVDGAGFFSKASSTGVDTPAQFLIGSRDGLFLHDGRIANVAFGKSPPGGIAAIATTIRDTLYNGGNGVDLRTIDAATKTAWGMVAGWPLDEVTGTRADVIGSNTLTSNNSVSHQNGPYTYNAVDSVVDRQWTGLAPSTAIATASALGVTAPIHKTGIKNGLPVERYDGTDDLFTLTSALVLSGDFTYCALVKVGAVPGAYFGHSSGTGFVRQLDTTHLDLNNDANTNLSMAHGALDTNFHVLTLVRSGSTVTRYLDGTLDGTGTLAGTITLNQMGRHGAATAPLNGDEGEQVLTTTALSGGTLTGLIGYMKRRWGVA